MKDLPRADSVSKLDFEAHEESWSRQVMTDARVQPHRSLSCALLSPSAFT